MAEWWTYRPADFVMFSARSYWRVYELYNDSLWPMQLATIGVGLALVVALARPMRGSGRAATLVMAACWLWVAWGFHWQHFAAVNTAATAFAAAFAVQGLLLLAAGLMLPGRAVDARSAARHWVGLSLMLLALLGQPLLALSTGRPWTQAEVFGVAPDPTVLATLGLLLLVLPMRDAASRHRGRAFFVTCLWPIPLLWAAVSGATLWVLREPQALLLPGAAFLALCVAMLARRRASSDVPSAKVIR